MNTIKDTKNSLLNRREVKLLVEHSGNPGLIKAKEIVATHFKSSPEAVAVKNLKSKFGRDTFLLDAYVYDSAEHKQRIEPKLKVKTKAGGST